jgi:hypothetical protein
VERRTRRAGASTAFLIRALSGRLWSRRHDGQWTSPLQVPAPSSAPKYFACMGMLEVIATNT